ncbi:MAG TPA: hypothetical protein VNO23_03935 [Candidatus Binatia bacterium]|nr:hypothetical protein [Candidatus Binatia bacterium]
MPRYLFVVSRRDQTLYSVLKERFADDPNVEVILDRRRPGPARPPPHHHERRTRPGLDRELETHSYAIVVLP